MSRHLDEDQDDLLTNRRPERELTLSTGAILGIFLGLVLLCGAFFGLGYKLGNGTHPSGVPTAAMPPDSSDAPGTRLDQPSSRTKPAAGSPVAVVPPNSAETATRPAGADGASGQSGNAEHTKQSNAVTSSALPHAAPPLPPRAADVEPMPAPSANGSFVVQVAAVSHQEDADLLVNALRAKGYTVAARSEPGDKLVHIQVGPFSNKKDADAMRQRLAADGYNAFIK